MAHPTFSSEVDLVRLVIGEATFKVDNDFYRLEVRREVVNADTEITEFMEIIVEENRNKKVHLIPSTLPWSEENTIEIRVTGMEMVDVEDFMTDVHVFLTYYILDNEDVDDIPDWLIVAQMMLTDLLDDWNGSVLPDTCFNEE